MAYSTVNKSSSVFNTALWTANGSGATVSSVGFQPDLVFQKCRTNTYAPLMVDSIRGVTKEMYTDGPNVNTTVSTGLTAFNSNGFVYGNAAQWANNGNDWVSWNWKAGTAMSGNTTGSGSYKTYTGTKNTASGFAIIKYTGNGTAGHQIPHNLGTAPKFMIVKSLASNNWAVFHQGMTLNGGNAGNAYAFLESTAEEAGGTPYWNGVYPSTTTFTVGTSNRVNTNDQEYIAYVWSEVRGYSSFNSYQGNNNADGTIIFCGFKPSFIICKTVTSNVQGGWQLRDNKRTPTGNLTNNLLYANASSSQQTTDGIDILSNGFKFRNQAGDCNASRKYIYMAWGQPMVGSNNVPNNAY